MSEQRGWGVDTFPRRRARRLCRTLLRRRRGPSATGEVTGIAALIGAGAGLVSAIGVLVVNGKVDRLTGRVDELSRAFNSHVNASH